jgi:phosphoribosyl-ATP pyrophosphohydrolase/phosphoribosyl-AMP cyclohydrolase
MNVDFEKMNNLVPVVIQHAVTSQVLMLGYMNEEAYLKTRSEGRVTFYSRSKQRLWTKGEESGHYLWVKEILLDCDTDAILILAQPKGPTCHNGTVSCFGEEAIKGTLYQLEKKIQQRIDDNISNSYTNTLYNKGINKVAQKVGEEAIELVIEAKDDNIDLFKNEAADLLYHLLILFKAKQVNLNTIEQVLQSRFK